MKKKTKTYLWATFSIVLILAGVFFFTQQTAFPTETLGERVLQLDSVKQFNYVFENFAVVDGRECTKSDRGNCMLVSDSPARSTVYLDSNGFVTYESSSAQGNLDYTMENQGAYSFVNISDLQEIIIILDGSLTAYRGRDSGYTISSGFGFGLTNGNQMMDIYSENLRTNTNMGTTDIKSNVIVPVVFKLMNNYDGSYTVYKGLGIGDVYMKGNTIFTSQPELYFYTKASSGAAGGSNAASSSNAYAKMRIMSIVTKENELARCTASQILTPTGCVDSQSLVMANEQALYESYNATIARINERLEAQKSYYDKQIADLQSQLASQTDEAKIAELNAKIAALEAKKPQIEETKTVVIEKIIEYHDVPLTTKVSNFFVKIWDWIVNLF